MVAARFTLVTDELLDTMVRRIVELFRPEKVILFGSRAWGTPRPDSDIDLFVVIESDLPSATMSAEISIACRPRGVAVDFIVRTPAELERRLQLGDSFIRRIVEHGRVLYAR